jgi:hypothetical protein
VHQKNLTNKLSKGIFPSVANKQLKMNFDENDFIFLMGQK